MCSRLAALPPPPFLSATDREESPLALATPRQRPARLTPLLELIVVELGGGGEGRGGLRFAQEIVQVLTMGFFRWWQLPAPTSPPPGHVACGQKNPDPITSNLPSPAPRALIYDWV